MINVLNRLEEVRGDESGFTTAELLGNAALGVVALAGIWFAIQGLGGNIITWVEEQMKGGPRAAG